MTTTAGPRQSSTSDTAVAVRASRAVSLNAADPAAEWAHAIPLEFCQDWQGRNADPERQTEVRLLWTPDSLYVRFVCRYRDVSVFDDSEHNGRRDHLWDRDVAEVFLQPDPSRPCYYKEFEVSPNGMWIDLDIFPHGRRDLESGVQHSAWLDRERRVWAAELAIPLRTLVADSNPAVFDPAALWRANFYRVEGQTEPRFYSAWQATGTGVPNFHVPESFGRLRFENR